MLRIRLGCSTIHHTKLQFLFFPHGKQKVCTSEIGIGMSFVHAPSYYIMLQIANWVLFLPFPKNSYRLLLYFMRERDRYQLLLYGLRALHRTMVCMVKILLCLL